MDYLVYIGLALVALAIIIVVIVWQPTCISGYIMGRPSNASDQAIAEILSDRIYINTNAESFMSFKLRGMNSILWTFYSPSQMQWKELGTIVLPGNIKFGEDAHVELLDAEKMYSIRPVDGSTVIELVEYYREAGKYKPYHSLRLIAAA